MALCSRGVLNIHAGRRKEAREDLERAARPAPAPHQERTRAYREECRLRLGP